MPDPYTILGVPADADDATIRRRYLELTREFPPEQHPEKFAAMRAAYEQVRTPDARARYRLFEAINEDTIDLLIEEAQCGTKRNRVKLTDLIATVCPPTR